MDFLDRMKTFFDKGIESSGELFGKAREKAQELGEKGVLKFEIMQLENQAEKVMAKLGTRVYEALKKEGAAEVTRETTGVQVLVDQIEEIETRIQEKEAALRISK
jgi:hypothetical protein